MNPAEGGDVLVLARRQGKYEVAAALEKKGYKTEDSSEQIPVNPKDETEEMKRKIKELTDDRSRVQSELDRIKLDSAQKDTSIAPLNDQLNSGKVI